MRHCAHEMIVSTTEWCSAVGERHLERGSAGPHEGNLDADFACRVVEPIRAESHELAIIAKPTLARQPFGEKLEFRRSEGRVVHKSHHARL